MSKFSVFTSHANWLFRFLQGPETDPATVRKIREAIDNQTEVTVQLINYTRTGKLFDFSRENHFHRIIGKFLTYCNFAGIMRIFYV